MLNFVANTISKPTYPLYWEGRQKDNGNALYIMVSNRSKLKNYFINSDKINLVYQFFIHKNEERNKELRYCLKKNVDNQHIDKIYLLNERMYSEKELGIKSDKIVQIIRRCRMKFSDSFDLIQKLEIRGYIIIGNADIFYDDTLRSLRLTDISEKLVIYSQLRLEYNSQQKLEKCEPFSDPEIGNMNDTSIKFSSNRLYPWVANNLADRIIEKLKKMDTPIFCPWSADTWIFHTNNISGNNNYMKYKGLDIPLGVCGVDNIIPAQFHKQNWEIRNEPYLFRCYHYHSTNIRSYNKKDKLQGGYACILPIK